VFHLVLTAFVRQLSGRDGRREVTVSVARAGRDARLPDVARLVGPFADTLPVLVTLPDDGDVAASARAVRDACLVSEQHAGVSTLDLARMLPAGVSTPRTAGSASFSFARFPAALDPGCPVRVTGTAARTGSAATRQGLLCWEFDGAFQFSWNYPATRWSPAEVDGLTDAFLAELATVVARHPVHPTDPWPDGSTPAVDAPRTSWRSGTQGSPSPTASSTRPPGASAATWSGAACSTATGSPC
jgi:hypothetical protein